MRYWLPMELVSLRLPAKSKDFFRGLLEGCEVPGWNTLGRSNMWLLTISFNKRGNNEGLWQREGLQDWIGVEY